MTERTAGRTEELPGALPGGHLAAAVSDISSIATLADPSAEALEHAATEVLEILLENDEARLATSPTELEHRLPLGARVIAGAVELLVTRGIARSRDGLVALTEQGRVEATRRVRRHRLTARLLSDVIGLEWWKVHGRTTSWEALVDEEMEARIVELLGDPGTCPHGNPIPGSANQPFYADAMLLDDAPVGPVRVVRITQTLVADDEALQLVQLCGFIPGSEVEIKSRRDGWVEVAGTVHDAAFPPHMARHIVVAPR